MAETLVGDNAPKHVSTSWRENRYAFNFAKLQQFGVAGSPVNNPCSSIDHLTDALLPSSAQILASPEGLTLIGLWEYSYKPLKLIQMDD
ncbi:MAG TPA: hypothetical protein VI457_09180 [Methylococcaceae bacterium]|nr:hypothetical protein [Methylococcaceae bacterium]